MSKSSLEVISVLVFLGLCLGPVRVHAQGSAGIPLEHFIYIIQENHSFDNYFGTFPRANGIPPGTALPDHPGGPLVDKPFLFPRTHVAFDLPHSWQAAYVTYDKGAMDAFMWGEWPAWLRYYDSSIPVPTPIAGLVHFRKRSHRSTQRIATPGEVKSPDGAIDDEDPAGSDVEERNAAIAAAAGTPKQPPNFARRLSG